mmetsp:Transcript_16035/g.42238  ORF Transcript_16035/g.42238 Transcript_16035/m.42238 type:complete len:229 (+) Transcript_16035:970-1656(+)
MVLVVVFPLLLLRVPSLGLIALPVVVAVRVHAVAVLAVCMLPIVLAVMVVVLVTVLVSALVAHRRAMQVVMLRCVLERRRVLARLLHQVVKVARLGRVLPQLLLDGGRDVVQLALRRLALLHNVHPQFVDQRVQLLVKLAPHLAEQVVSVAAVRANLFNQSLLVVADGSEQPRPVRRQDGHVVHLVLEMLLKERAEPHDAHVRGMLLLPVLQRVHERIAPLHVDFIRG